MKPPTAERFFRVLKSIHAAPTAAEVRRAALHGLRRLQSPAGATSPEARELQAVFHALIVEQCNRRLRNLATRQTRRREPAVADDYQRLSEAGLTLRECEVLAWIAHGKRDAEIAQILGISPRTVGKHIEHLLRKLHAETRTAAVNIARDQLRHA